MLDKEMLEAISKMMDEKLKPIQDEISSMKEDVSLTLKEVKWLAEDQVGDCGC